MARPSRLVVTTCEVILPTQPADVSLHTYRNNVQAWVGGEEKEYEFVTLYGLE